MNSHHENYLESWEHFLECAEAANLGSIFKESLAWRGQADADWSLDPTLARILRHSELTKEQAIALERKVQDIFVTKCATHIPPPVYFKTTSRSSWWCIMQHYSAPTRLLDWTSSPFVAAYFAANQLPDRDGAVWMASTVLLSDAHAIAYPEFRDPASIQEDESVWLNPQSPSYIRFVGGMQIIDRMQAQQSLFSICADPTADHADIIGSLIPDNSDEAEIDKPVPLGLAKFIIAARQKKEFLRRLHAMNITASSLFPGMDGLGREASELYQLDTATFGQMGMMQGTKRIRVRKSPNDS